MQMTNSCVQQEKVFSKTRKTVDLTTSARKEKLSYSNVQKANSSMRIGSPAVMKTTSLAAIGPFQEVSFPWRFLKRLRAINENSM